MRLEISRRARADLEGIGEYSIRHFGLSRALAYLDTIDATFALIVSNPSIGRAADGPYPSLRSIACRSHRIYYERLDDRLIVRRILHKAMDPDRHL